MSVFAIMEEDKIIKRCVLSHCKLVRGDVLHKFPRNRLRWLQWLNALHMSESEVALKRREGDLFLCSRHFRNEDYSSKKPKALLQSAVPSLHLNRLCHLDRSHSIPGVKFCSAYSSRERRAATLERHSSISLPTDNVAMVNPEINQTDETVSCSANRSIGMNTQSAVSSTTVLPTTTVAEASTSRPSVNSITEVDDIKKEYAGVISTSSESLKIVHNLVSSACNVNSKWLRGQCHCSECFDATTHTYRIDIFDSVLNVMPVTGTILDDSGQLKVVWDDNHTSTYDLDFIVSQVNSTKISNYKQRMERQLWSAKHTKYRDDFKPLQFQDIMLHKHSIKTAIDRLQRSGILLIDRLPDTQNDITMKKLCITKLFNCSMDNAVMERRNNFMNKRSMPYTNCTFESIDKNIQIITMSHKTLEKIQLVLVDGFNIAQQMQNRHTNEYITLKTSKQIFTFKNKQHYKYTVEKKVLNTDSEQQMERILFAPYNMTDIKHQNLDDFLPAMCTMSKLFKATDNHWSVDLYANRLLVLDNYRICWNLTWQDDSRSLSPNLECYYIERKHFLSSLYTLNVDT